ncbi:sulfite exporter TauE/SafE family protein [Roseococcus sp. SYP-B2431]|uniref:sulfite exporter TauE/SafE family protein n=1 Tax=Roseococcus sp. SYP-B2431 TaxID=2496640 RepID=UPI00103B7058|nr:sulfite exporter TauE/SafE family protein [Roseococcus sp. SYP-B2431]TCH99533.1 sulfite exporter TauE/SafE family protein [Roseococcus sp. SYP-B2431]
MSLPLAALLGAVMICTALLSGIFGMAGGLILVGVLLALMPLPEAMALHAITQMGSNGWRAILWIRYVRWRSVGAYLTGSVLATAAWATVQFVPDKPWALLALGATPFLARALPQEMRPDPDRISHGLCYGAACMMLMLVTGVTGPLSDAFFLSTGQQDRRQIVATKAFCQVVSHALKFVYFAALIPNSGSVSVSLAVMGVACSMIGTTLARRVLDAMTDTSFRKWSRRLITVIGLFYLAQGAWLLIAGWMSDP